MKKFWALFFFFWPTVAIIVCVIAPSRGWWFPSPPMSTTGDQIDGLFMMINIIVTITFIATQYVLGYALWMGATKEPGEKAFFSHGSHKLEILWTIVPSFILIFISLSQLDVLAEIRVITSFPDAKRVAEVTARQFEWRIRYPKPGTELTTQANPGDLYYVNELHVPTGKPIAINLRTQDVQHAFFSPQLRVKQDAVPGLVIPIWFDVKEVGTYDLVCAELCGWGHYKMKARIVAQSQSSVDKYLLQLEAEQNEDGTKSETAASEE